MRNKGVDTEGKDLIVTNGFTEGFDLVLSAITQEGDRIICENPTHNTAIKIMKLHGLNIVGVNMDDDGINIEELKQKLSGDIKAGYLVPSYHNPTGIVMHPDKRLMVYDIFREIGFRE
jgi:DNA-binding transcriptional MocR family regulator